LLKRPNHVARDTPDGLRRAASLRYLEAAGREPSLLKVHFSLPEY